ncbi:phosphoribosyl-ATP pyrophosphohydrolase [Alteribacter lacisalsi]|uniref:Phosphoribosyl-ATP pyrophosphohydrolase n=1 Tax=Alteribacter lacisalsi TaxID=2045244 RepID=A0A2W0HHD8_9BACI|nr:nucleoside triphosphate pyrophosphohydrolase [Alteribacter lacisalsi]PYZ96845.1 phosphoribosyl-ATP pyrophosphohydrolase [Alteribacter lacisalsi]
MIYNKLVRDRIPEIIEKSGKEAVIEKLTREEYIKAAREKLFEEIDEYIDADKDEDAVEELADLLELIYALGAVHGASAEILEKLRKKKAETRGGFQERLYLKEVKE